MDQREWDYGARMPRDRRAAQPYPTPSPERTDFTEAEPKWASLTDTGSMEPSPEALAWQRRADQWAQQSESDSASVEPASRWSEVASTGRPTFPADGVGWRSETAEWRATGARWRQTTEWRSTTGSHGWRSTTEAWTGGSDSYDPPVEAPTSQPAISSTAWSSPDAPADEQRPAWQQFTAPAAPWEQQQQSTPSWQQPSQRPPAESSPSWQQLVDPGSERPTWGASERPSWQRDAIDGTATWSDPDSARSSTKGADSMSSWLRMEDPAETPSWQTSRDDGRHLVREDDRAAWRQNADQGGGSPSVGRRRAPEGGTGWGSQSDSDNWAGHTDTGNIPLFADPVTPSWASPDAGSGRHDGSAGRRALPSSPYDESSSRRSRHDEGIARSASAAMPLSYDTRPSGGHAADPPSTPRRGRYADETPAVEPPRGSDPATGSFGRGAPYGAEPPTGGFGRGTTPPTSSPGYERGAQYPDPQAFGRGTEPPPAAPTTGFGRGAAPAYPDTPSSASGFGRGTGYTDPQSAPGYGRGAEPPAASPTTGYGRGAEPGYGRGAEPGYGRGAEPGYGRGAEPPAAAPTTGYGRGAEPPAASPTTGYGRGAEPPAASPTTGYGRGAEPPAAAPTTGFGRGTEPGYGRGAEPPAAAPTTGFGRGTEQGGPGFGRGEQRRRGGEQPTTSFSRVEEQPASAPTTGFGRGAAPAYPVEQPGVGRRRSRAEEEPTRGPEPDRFGADGRGGVESGARSAPAGGRRARPEGPSRPSGRGKARYSEVDDDWREHTGSWAAEPDTSSWVRDPDTGQWSRSDDDPRVQAWREEAARREAMNHTAGARRELPAGPAKPEPPRPAPEDDWRGGPSSSPRSAMPASPRSAMPASPRSAMPASPRSAMPESPSSSPRSAMPASPRSAMPASRRSASPYGDDAYPSAPRSGTPYGTPRRELPSGRARADETGFGTAPTSGPTYGPGGPSYGGGPYGGASATYGGAPAGPAYGSARRALPSGPARPDEPGDYPGSDPYGDGSGSSPRSGTPYGGAQAPRSGTPFGDGPAPRSGTPYGDGPAPRSGTPYGDGPAPRTGTPYGGGGGATDYRGGGRRRADEGVDGGGRRRAAAEAGYEQSPSTDGWRRELEAGPGRETRGTGAAPWSGGGAPANGSWTGGAPAKASWTGGAPADATWTGGPGADATWTGGGAPADARQTGDWRLEFAERPEGDGHGSASYREGRVDDWRRDLSDDSNLAEGESRRFGTSDYVPFRPSGAASVPRASNLSMTSTSLISPVPREQREPMVRPQRTGGGFQQSATGSYERRPVTGGFPTSRRSDLLDPDDEEDDQDTGGPLAAIGYTVIWYGVPIVLFVVYMLVVNTGSQSHALDTLAKAAPQFLISLVLSVIVALGLRKFSSSWKAISVGLAAAVVGGGLATVLSSAITGNSLS